MGDKTNQVIETVDERFEADVLVRSQNELVVVDFWADWCAPCRALAPILETLAEAYQGRLAIVKACTDDNPQAAQRFAVASIPAVFAVLNEETIDQFQGGADESALREWLEKCLMLADIFVSKRLASESPELAEARLRAIADESPSDAAQIALLELLFESGRDEECHAILEGLSRRGFLEPSCERIRAMLELRSKAGGDIESLEAAVRDAAGDFASKFALAETLAGRQRYEEAFKICLELVRDDRQATGEEARALMVDAFRVLGDDAELTRDYRRKLSMVLY